MANQITYYPMYVPTNSSDRTSREKHIQECIEKDSELEALSLASQPFSEEQIQQVQNCADDMEHQLRLSVPWIILAIVLIAAIIGFIVTRD